MERGTERHLPKTDDWRPETTIPSSSSLQHHPLPLTGRPALFPHHYLLSRLKRILREGFHILSSDPSTQDLLTKPPLVTLCKPPNLRQLMVDTSLRTHNPVASTGSRPCNRPRCKTCPIHPPASSFTTSCTNLTYPITTHAECKSMNLIYQLQCNLCKSFYIGDTRHSLSDRMNGHRFTTTVLNSDLPVAIHTQFHQIPFQDC